jgi:Cytochrome bd terminal oxidase subunit II
MFSTLKVSLSVATILEMGIPPFKKPSGRKCFCIGTNYPPKADIDRGRDDVRKVPKADMLFVAAFLSLAVMFWPYMIPYSVTVAAAAAPEASLSFLFWGAGLFVLPVIGAYTAVVYWMFRGKQRRGYTPTSALPSP